MKTIILAGGYGKRLGPSTEDKPKIIEFKEKPILKEYWINAGIYLFSNKIFDYLLHWEI